MSQLNAKMADERIRLLNQHKELKRKMTAMQLLVKAKMGLDVATLIEDIPLPGSTQVVTSRHSHPHDTVLPKDTRTQGIILR